MVMISGLDRNSGSVNDSLTKVMGGEGWYNSVGSKEDI